MQLFSHLCLQGLQRIHGTTFSLQAIHTQCCSRTYTKAEPIFAQSHRNWTPAAHIFLELNSPELADGCQDIMHMCYSLVNTWILMTGLCGQAMAAPTARGGPDPMAPPVNVR